MKLWRRPTFWVAVVAVGAILLATLLTGCDQVGTPAQIHPTHAGPNGECVEWDDEPCDDDPFDTDDLVEDSHKKASPKPAPQPSPAKPRTVTTRRR